MQFAILKGACGFGDRLQCLLQAIGLRAHDRTAFRGGLARSGVEPRRVATEVEDCFFPGGVQTMRRRAVFVGWRERMLGVSEKQSVQIHFSCPDTIVYIVDDTAVGGIIYC